MVANSKWWTDEERLKVIHSYHDMVLKETIPSRAENAWRKAQQVLPPARHRPFNNSPSTVALNKLYKKLLANGAFTKKVAPAIQVPPPPPEKTMVYIEGFGPMRQSVYETVIAHFTTAHPNPRPTLDEVFSRLIDERVQAAIPKIFAGVDERLVEHQNKMQTMMHGGHVELMKYLDPSWVEPATALDNAVEAAKVVQKSHKPVVVLVNANAAQQQTIQKEFPQFEIRLADGKVPAESSPLLVVGFTKFMDASLDKACLKKFDDSYLKISPNGAASEAKFKIRSRLANVLFEAPDATSK